MLCIGSLYLRSINESRQVMGLSDNILLFVPIWAEKSDYFYQLWRYMYVIN